MSFESRRKGGKGHYTPRTFLQGLGNHGPAGEVEESSENDKGKFSDGFLHRKFFVEVRKGGFAGSISAVFRNGRIADLKDFYVIEGPENSGLRDRLLDKAVNYCRAHGVKKIRVKTFPDLKQFFKNKGFVTEKRLKDHFQAGEDTLVVSKLLQRK